MKSAKISVNQRKISANIAYHRRTFPNSLCYFKPTYSKKPRSNRRNGHLSLNLYLISMSLYYTILIQNEFTVAIKMPFRRFCCFFFYVPYNLSFQLRTHQYIRYKTQAFFRDNYTNKNNEQAIQTREFIAILFSKIIQILRLISTKSVSVIQLADTIWYDAVQLIVSFGILWNSQCRWVKFITIWACDCNDATLCVRFVVSDVLKIVWFWRKRKQKK